jgi:aminopeptidase YwaD
MSEVTNNLDRTVRNALLGVALALLLLVVGVAFHAPSNTEGIPSRNPAPAVASSNVSIGSPAPTPSVATRVTITTASNAAAIPGVAATPKAVVGGNPTLIPGTVPVATALSPVATLSPQPYRPRPTGTPAAFSPTEALRQLGRLADQIGSRPTGSTAERQATAMLKTQLATLGYSPSTQPYSFSTFQDRSARLLLTSPETLEVNARTFHFSAGGTVEGRLVDCGLGRPADLPQTGLKGLVALIGRGGGLTFDAKLSNAVTRGAAAAIVYNDQPGELKGSLPQPAIIPVVGIIQFDGQRLLEYAKAGTTTVRVAVDATLVTHTGENVLANNPGNGNGKKIVIGAHYDSSSVGQGANDNASGVAALLEVARVVKGREFPFDLEFVLFGDEEVGLIGSKKYVAFLSPQQRSQVTAMVNLDMVGAGARLQFAGDRTLVARAMQVGQRDGYRVYEAAGSQNSTSDHASFLEAGIPAVMLNRAEDPNYHTPLDTSDKILPANLEAAGAITLRLLEDLAKR